METPPINHQQNVATSIQVERIIRNPGKPITSAWFAIEKDTENDLVLLAFNGSMGAIYKITTTQEAREEMAKFGTSFTLNTAKVTNLSGTHYPSPENQIRTLELNLWDKSLENGSIILPKEKRDVFFERVFTYIKRLFS